MRKEIKLLIESITVSLIFVMAIFVYFTIKRRLITKSSLPNIVHEHEVLAYEAVENTSNTVRIVWIKPFAFSEYITIFLVTFSVYFLIRFSFWRYRNAVKARKRSRN